MYYVRTNTEEAKFTEEFAEFLHQNQLSTTNAGNLTIGCENFEQVSGIISALSRANMPIDNIDVTQNKPDEAVYLKSANN